MMLKIGWAFARRTLIAEELGNYQDAVIDHTTLGRESVYFFCLTLLLLVSMFGGVVGYGLDEDWIRCGGDGLLWLPDE
jgi:hypothetical protein